MYALIFKTVSVILLSLLQCQAIFNGTEVKNISEIPYQVALLLDGRHECGGSFISESWILTAAHCINDTLPLSFRAGSIWKSKEGVIIHPERIEQHPEFNKTKLYDYDFALIKLKKWDSTGVIYESIKLAPEGATIPDHTLLTASGWGITEENVKSEVLRYVKVPKYNQKECEKRYNLQITGRMLCAGYPNGGKDACEHDSGGPLTYNKTLVGVVSFGVPPPCCGCTSMPGVYARVTSVRSWIKKVTNI